MNALKNLLNLLFPNLCNGCKALLINNEKTVCLRCRHELPYTNHLQQPDNETYKKFYGKLPVEHASSIIYFQKEGITQQLIHNLKYKGAEEVGHFFGALYAENINQNHILQTVDYIIPVPLHPKKLRERGYNQVTTFGKTLAANSGKNYQENILFRTQYSKTQTKKNVIGRAEATKDIFDVNFSETDYGKHFLLIDDVITTGSTLQDCGRALLKIPGAKISVLTIAYAQS